MNIVEKSGGLHNTLAMEAFDKGYADCTAAQKALVDERVTQLGLCPRCGEKPTFKDASGTLWDSNAHYWREKSGGDERT